MTCGPLSLVRLYVDAVDVGGKSSKGIIWTFPCAHRFVGLWWFLVCTFATRPRGVLHKETTCKSNPRAHGNTRGGDKGVCFLWTPIHKSRELAARRIITVLLNTEACKCGCGGRKLRANKCVDHGLSGVSIKIVSRSTPLD